MIIVVCCCSFVRSQDDELGAILETFPRDRIDWFFNELIISNVSVSTRRICIVFLQIPYYMTCTCTYRRLPISVSRNNAKWTLACIWATLLWVSVQCGLTQVRIKHTFSAIFYILYMYNTYMYTWTRTRFSHSVLYFQCLMRRVSRRAGASRATSCSKADTCSASNRLLLRVRDHSRRNTVLSSG